jgi:hypothetical protein
MRKIIYSVVCLCMLGLAACNSHDDPEPTTAQKLLGKWKLQKEVDESYQPMNVLINTDETMGEPGDSVVFKNDGNVFVYSPTYGEDVTTYEILNDTTVKIEDEMYRIRKLTTTELNLYWEDVYPALNSREVQRLYFVR